MPSIEPSEGAPSAPRPLFAGNWSGANFTLYSVVAFPYTGDYRIDTLLGGMDNRWNAGQPLGTPVTVTFSFMSATPVYGGTDADGAKGFTPFNLEQRTAVKAILSHLQAQIGVTFREVTPDTATSYGQIRFGNNVQAASAGYTWLPFSMPDDRSGDVWIDVDSPGNLNPLPGNRAWEVLVHEIGHALGLKHPGNYNAGGSADPQAGNYLAASEDNSNYTIMSYYQAAGRQPRDWFAMYDLLALKALYGANPTYQAGDTPYRFSDASGLVLGVLDDRAGVDTLDFSSLTIGATVNLRPGAFSSVGWNGSLPAYNNLSVDFSTVIENVIGSSEMDVVVGNDAPNVFSLGAGNNRANGGGGVDTEVYAGPRAGYEVAQANGAITVTGANLNDTLTSMERLQFGDGSLAFDLAGAAGSAAKILGAVFGSGAVLEPEVVGKGVDLLDGGVPLAEAAAYALQARLGPGASNSAVVDLLYFNLTGHPPTAEEHAHYQAMLDGGGTSQADLVLFAAALDLNLANIDFAGLASTGLSYT